MGYSKLQKFRKNLTEFPEKLGKFPENLKEFRQALQAKPPAGSKQTGGRHLSDEAITHGLTTLENALQYGRSEFCLKSFCNFFSVHMQNPPANSSCSGSKLRLESKTREAPASSVPMAGQNFHLNFNSL